MNHTMVEFRISSVSSGASTMTNSLVLEASLFFDKTDPPPGGFRHEQKEPK